ncbi:hypothetical protein [Pseudomonas asplenii]
MEMTDPASPRSPARGIA